MKRLNLYFFGESEINLLDGFWFYGTNLGIIALLILLIFMNNL